MNDPNSRRLLEEAYGYIKLGLTTEAEALLRKVMTDDPAARDYAQSELMILLLRGRRHQEAADAGADLIARGVFRQSAIINTMLALHFLGRIEKARDTLRLVEKCGHTVEEDAYQMACFASRLGEFPEALRWLLFEFRRSREYYAQAFVDTDLIPFWKWLRDYRPTLEEAHLLLETPFKDVCAVALGKEAPIQLSSEDLTHLADGASRLFRYDDDAGYFTLNPSMVAGEPAAAAQLMRDWKTGLGLVEECIRKAHAHASDVVLDAQVRYATEHAGLGNHLGARYHILWALPLRPSLMLRFLEEPGLKLMEPFLFEIIGADAADSTFRDRMQEVMQCGKSDPDRAWKLLEETPASARTTGLFQLRLAGLYNAEKDYERALPIWQELRRLWPDDVAGFGNAITALQGLGRIDEARRLLAAAPACYRRFRLYWSQMAALEGRSSRHFPPAACPAFRGQPDLGGLLIPETESEAGRQAETESRIL